MLMGLALAALLASSLATARGAGAQEDTLVIERHRLPRAPEARAGNRMLTVVRVDLRRYRLTVLSARATGARGRSTPG
jgi:hypothetical protein